MLYSNSVSFGQNDTVLVNQFNLPVYFDVDNAEIKAEYFPILQDLVSYLKDSSSYIITISVHFDERYSELYSTCLSCLRASAIKDALVENGIEESRINANGKQGKEPIIKNAKNEEEHQINRRIEVKVYRIIVKK